MERKKLTSDEIESRLGPLQEWRVDGQSLLRRFEFANFAESLAFVNKVGDIAEAADHHPDITFGWGYAELRTMTHDRGGITDVDFALIEKIDQLT